MTINPQNVVDRPMPHKWQAIVDLLPKHNWEIAPAARETGYYTEYYINSRLPVILGKDVRFCNAVAKKKAEIARKYGWDVDRWVRETSDYYEDSKQEGVRSGIEFCLDRLGRHVGVYEADNRQRSSNIGIVIM